MSQQPTLARVRSIAHWNRLFHPQDGVFREPYAQGVFIEHLDIDVRFVEPTATHDMTFLPVKMPNVVVVTLRAAQDEDNADRVKCLVEILEGLQPCEVRWLTNSDELLLSPSHFVHPLFVDLGRKWSAKRCLQRLVVQGGFPCSNITDSYFDKRTHFAFGSWSVARIEWCLQEYKSTAATAIVRNYVRDVLVARPPVLPGSLAFAAKSSDVVLRLRDMLQDTPMPRDITEWLQDSVFLVQHDCASRVWYEEPDCQQRLLSRLRADLLIAQDYPIIPPAHMLHPDVETVQTP